MADDLWRLPVQDLILNAAQTRAAHYRAQAAELRKMAEGEGNQTLSSDLLDLAQKYDALADSVSD